MARVGQAAGSLEGILSDKKVQAHFKGVKEKRKAQKAWKEGGDRTLKTRRSEIADFQEAAALRGQRAQERLARSEALDRDISSDVRKMESLNAPLSSPFRPLTASLMGDKDSTTRMLEEMYLPGVGRNLLSFDGAPETPDFNIAETPDFRLSKYWKQ
jgi:hypothetical protein